MTRNLTLIAIAASGLLSACATVGPDYKGPPATPATASFHRAEPATATAAATPPAARWWLALNDPELDRLIHRALADSPNVKVAQARLRSARAGLAESRTAFLPRGGAKAGETSLRLPLDSIPGQANPGKAGQGHANLNLYNAGLDATWELDLFGETRRSVEAAAASAGQVQATLEDVQVELSAEVGQSYVVLRDAQTRLNLAKDAVELQSKAVALVRQRQARGAAADGDLDRAETGLDQAQAQVAPLKARVDELKDQLAMLTGQTPGALDAELAQPAAAPAPPALTPVGDPAEMLRRRPDVRAAERRLAASNARIGQNVAEYFPKVTLIGDIGFTSTDASRLLRSSSTAALGGPSLSWNILNYPRIQAEVQGAVADRDAALAQYQAGVLSALQDAEASLSRYGGQRQSLEALTRAEASAQRAADVTRRRYEAGTASLIDLLDAQRQAIAAREALAQGRAALTSDWIALQKSLGLGWGG